MKAAREAEQKAAVRRLQAQHNEESARYRAEAREHRAREFALAQAGQPIAFVGDDLGLLHPARTAVSVKSKSLAT